MFRLVIPALLIIHGICAAVYAAMIIIGRSHLRREYIIPIFFVPVFGIVAAIVIDMLADKLQKEDYPDELHSFKLDGDAYWKTISQRKEARDILPLEEAVLINDNKTRRKLMLETLFDDPYKYLDVLMISKNNEDIETAHYATTTISKIQRDFQMGIQKMAAAVSAEPINEELLDHYLEFMGKYVESGVLEDYLLKRQRLIYSKELDKKLAFKPADKATLINKIDNCVKLKDFDSAFKFCDVLKSAHPIDEETWIQVMRVCVESNDTKRLKKTAADISTTPIDWSKSGREQVLPWIKS